jgi:hypothetical protein
VRQARHAASQVLQQRQLAGDVDEEDGTVFINKDGTTFDVVLNLLRGYPMPSTLSPLEVKSLVNDLEYFLLVDAFAPPALPVPALVQTSAVLKGLPDARAAFAVLQGWLGGKKTIGKLLYRHTSMGSSLAAFHQHCDGKRAHSVY